MTIKVFIKNEEPSNGRSVTVTKQNMANYPTETVTLPPQTSREFLLWGPWELLLKEAEPNER